MNVRAMVETLARQEYDVSLLVYPVGEDVVIPGVTIIRSWKLPGVKAVAIGPSWSKLGLDVLMAIKALKLAFTNSYDLFHGVEEGGFIAGVLGPLRKKPYIYDMDSCMCEQLTQRRMLRGKFLASAFLGMEAFFIRRSAAVLTVCLALTEKVRRIDGGVHIAQIEDFPSEASYDSNPEKVQAIRTALGLTTADRVVVYTGNFEPYQGMNLLLNAFALAVKRQTENPLDAQRPLKLVLVGGGELGSDAVVAKQRLAERLGIASRVIFTGNKPGSEMGSYLALGDVLVSPRIEGENTPLKIYSYMAAGRPVIATNIRSHTQVLNDKNSYLAPAQPVPFGEVLFHVLSEDRREQRAQKAAHAKELVETRYSRESFDRRLCRLYARIFGGAAEKGQLHQLPLRSQIEQTPVAAVARQVPGQLPNQISVQATAGEVLESDTMKVDTAKQIRDRALISDRN